VGGALPANSAEVTALAFLPDGKTIVSAHSNGGLQFHDAAGKKIADLAVPGSGVLAVAVAPDGKTLASGGRDGAVRLWDVETRKERKALTGHQQPVSALAFAPDGKSLASGGYDGTIRLWDLPDGKERKSWGATASRVTSLAFAADGKTLASAGARPMPVAGFALASADNARLWNVADGKALAALGASGSTVALGPDDRLLAVGGYQMDVGGPMDQGPIRINQTTLIPAWRVTLIDRDTSREVLRLNSGGALALTPDGRFLVTGRGTQLHTQGLTGVHFGGGPEPQQGVTLWEVQTGLTIQKLNLADGNPTVLAVSPDGTHLAVGSRDGKVHLASLTPEGWDAAAAKRAGAKELEQAWADLAGEPLRAYRGTWTLTAAAERSLKLLGEKLAPVKVDLPRIRKLVADLDARRFPVREAALKELRQMGYDAEPELRRLHKGKLSLEVSKRVEELLAALADRQPPPEALRPLRAVLILERIHTLEAKQLLERLTTGEPEARLTREATLALARLKR
jgi:hypothetical protein